MKRIYTVNDNGTISTSANIDMKKEDIKKMLSDMLGDAISTDVFSELGSLFDKANLQCTEQSTYTFGKDNWVKSITSEMTTSAMGMSMSMKSKVTSK